jgi:predicted alpha/beta-hydrolase family hydrolase
MTVDFRVACKAAGEDVLISARVYEPKDAPVAWLILAPGAGAGHDSAFMVSYARALSARRLTTVTFNFPYIERGRRVPDPARTLESCWTSVAAAVRDRAGATAALVAGGKSMGGRIASQVAADGALSGQLAGLVFLGYPLHPPGRPDRLRDAHLPAVARPMLFVQGTRDAFGTPGDLAPILGRVSPTPTMHAVTGGDHSFKLGGRNAAARQAAVYEEIQRAIVDWMVLTADRAGGR